MLSNLIIADSLDSHITSVACRRCRTTIFQYPLCPSIETMICVYLRLFAFVMACQLMVTNGLLLKSLSLSTRMSTVAMSMAAEATAISSLSPLVAEDGSSLMSSSEELKERFEGKRVALYFSAGWCPMCTSFEPALIQFKKAAEDSGKPVEIVYVPSDRSQSDASKRAESMGMVAIPFDRAGDYKKSFGVWAGSEALKFGFGGRRSGVPALVVLDPKDGTELAFVAAESQGPSALGDWPLDDGVW